MSDHLFSAIRVGKKQRTTSSYRRVEEFDSTSQMSNLTVQRALKFLTQQGFEVSLTLKDEQYQKKAVAGSGKVIEFPRRE
jgi:hypothetical protein